MTQYLDDNGNPIAAPAQVTYLNPNTGEPMAAQAQANFASNPKGEGTYNMWDQAGHKIPVPYSQVPVARGQGYTFDSNAGSSGLAPMQQFAKDEAADPNRVGGTSLRMAPAGAQWTGQAEPQSRQEALQRQEQQDANAPLASQLVTGAMKGAGTLVRPVIDVINLGLGKNGNTPAEESAMLQARTPAETVAKVGIVGAALAPGVVMAPAATAIGMGAGTLASYGAGAAANALGADPKLSAVVGDVAGLGAGIGGAAAATRLQPQAVMNGSLRSAWNFARNEWARPALAGDVNAPIPGAQGLTPAARYASMQNVGMQPNAAEATNSTPLNMAEKVNQDSLTAAPTYTAARGNNLDAVGNYAGAMIGGMGSAGREASEAALNQHAGNTLETISRAEPEDAGAATTQGLSAAQMKEQALAAQGYLELDQQMKGPKLSGAWLRQAARQIYDKNVDYYTQHPELVPTNAWKIVKDLAGTDTNPPTAYRNMSFSELHQLRSDLLEIVRTNPDLVKNQAGGWLQTLANAADQTMTDAGKGMTPDQLATYRGANQAWANMKNTFDNPRHPFYQALRSTSPSRVPDLLSTGAAQTTEIVGQLKQALGPEGMGPIQRSVAEKLLGSTKEGGYDLKGFQARWNNVPDAYKNALFTPEQLQQLNDIGNAGTILHESSNPNSATPPTWEVVDRLGEVLGPQWMGGIRRGVAENLLGSTKEGGYNLKTFQGKLNKVPEAYRNALFTPEQLQQLNDIGNAGTVLHADANPSGTAHMGQQMGEGAELINSAGHALGGSPGNLGWNAVYHGMHYGLGKLMNNPGFVDWLMRGRGFSPIQDAPAVPIAPATSRLIPAAVASGAMASGWDWDKNRPKQ